MKCPHCKRPVHVLSLKLDKGRTKFVVPSSVKSKGDTAVKHLATLIKYMNTVEMFSYRRIGEILGVSEVRPKDYVNREAE